jgi:hypothetical protein
MSIPRRWYQILLLVSSVLGLISGLTPLTLQAAAPANDLCANAIPMESGTTYSINIKDATSVSDPAGGNDTATYRGVWYTVTPKINQRVNINTCDSDFNTSLTVYKGSCGALQKVVANDDDGPYCRGLNPHPASVSFTSASNVTYYVFVGGSGPNSWGQLNIVADLQDPPPNDTCAGAIPLLPGVVQTVASTFYATEIDDPPGGNSTATYRGVWYTVTPKINQRVNINTCDSDFNTSLTVYKGSCGALQKVVANDDDGPYCRGLNPHPASVSFTSASNVTYYVFVGGSGPNSWGQLNIVADLQDPPPNDTCAGAIPLLPGVVQTVASTFYATEIDDPPGGNSTATYRGVWYTVNPKINQQVGISTCDSNFDTSLTVYKGSCGALQKVVANDDDGPYCRGLNPHPASVSFTSTDAVGYYIFVGGSGPAPWGQLDIVADYIPADSAPPSIRLSSPTDGQSFAIGQAIPLSAVVSNAPPGSKVSFVANGSEVGTASSAPYTFNWTTAPSGTSTVSAKLLDANLGVIAATPSLSVTVSGSNEPPRYRLDQGHYAVSEKDGHVDVTVLKLGGRAGTVSYSSQGGSALAADPDGLGDFFPAQGSTNLVAGDGSFTVRIRLIDDPILREPNPRKFTFSIQVSPESGVLIEPSTAQIEITDDDEALTSTLAFLPPKTRWPATGWLKVALTPAEAVGQWRFPWEPEWRAAGAIYGPLEKGLFPVEFMPRDGYQALEPVDLSVSEGPISVPSFFQTNYVAIPVPDQKFGSLRVNLVFLDSSPTAHGRWRLRDRVDDQWHAGGATLSHVLAGPHVIEFEAVSHYVTPGPRIVKVQTGPDIRTVLTAGYQPMEPVPANAQKVLTPDQVQDSDPFKYGGQLATDAGFASGMLIRPRVVLTAAHVLFLPGTTNPVRSVRWFFERHRDYFEPRPLVARGWYVPTNYLAALAAEPQHDGLSTASHESDIAAVYFGEDAGRGGYSGYLVGNPDPGQWLNTRNPVAFVGYPLDNASGQMHAGLNLDIRFQPFERSRNVFTTTALAGLPGSSGGALCIQTLFGNQLPYYPAAVYLGQSGDLALFRVIEREADGVIKQAEISSYTGQNHVGGGIPFLLSEVKDLRTRISLKVILSSDALNAGIGWRVADGEDLTYHFGTETVLELPDGAWSLEFISKTTTPAPAALPFSIEPDQSLEVTVGLAELKFESIQSLPDGKFRILVRASPSSPVAIESSADLQNWENQPGLEQLASPTGEAEFQIPAASTPRTRFFRVRIK